MKTDLIRIGNSRGLRIPKPLIEQLGLGDKVELRVENDRLVISPERRPRDGRSRDATPAARSFSYFSVAAQSTRDFGTSSHSPRSAL